MAGFLQRVAASPKTTREQEIEMHVEIERAAISQFTKTAPASPLINTLLLVFCSGGDSGLELARRELE